jgi:hypothetical protein
MRKSPSICMKHCGGMVSESSYLDNSDRYILPIISFLESHGMNASIFTVLSRVHENNYSPDLIKISYENWLDSLLPGVAIPSAKIHDLLHIVELEEVVLDNRSLWSERLSNMKLVYESEFVDKTLALRCASMNSVGNADKTLHFINAIKYNGTMF